MDSFTGELEEYEDVFRILDDIIGLKFAIIDHPDTDDACEDLFAEFGYERFFGRMEDMKVLSITASPASTLIKKMLDMKLIYPMKGKGKGKYLFKR